MADFVCPVLLSEVNMLFTDGMQHWLMSTASVDFTFLHAPRGPSTFMCFFGNEF